jgi:hypothetical protein
LDRVAVRGGKESVSLRDRTDPRRACRRTTQQEQPDTGFHVMPWRVTTSERFAFSGIIQRAKAI